MKEILLMFINSAFSCLSGFVLNNKYIPFHPCPSDLADGSACDENYISGEILDGSTTDLHARDDFELEGR